ncbi:MAG: tripartite tricarboxylate transporter substrate binding protein [Alcaligenaceae bacterium]
MHTAHQYRIAALSLKSLRVVTCLLLTFFSGHAGAQAWPGKPITMISPYPAGGGVDTVTRLIADRLAPALNSTITVENRPGAGATIGAAQLARSAPDGYTLMVGSIVDYAIAPHAHPALSFEMKRDLLPVVQLGFGLVGLVINVDVPAKDLKELIALVKAKPNALSYASSGVGGQVHLNMELFKQMSGTDIVHVPYRGTTQFMPDLLSGRVAMSLDSLPAHLANIRAGKTRALAVGSAERSSTLPEVPTFIEAGLTGYEAATNYTLFTPTNTPKDIVARLNLEVNIILKRADVIEKLGAIGITVIGGSTASAQARIPVEIEKWTQVIKAGNLVLTQ